MFQRRRLNVSGSSHLAGFFIFKKYRNSIIYPIEPFAGMPIIIYMTVNKPSAESKIMTTIKTCSRCKGKGMVSARVAHCGVSGLCFKCNGSGQTQHLTVKEKQAELIKMFTNQMQEILDYAANVKTQLEQARRDRPKSFIIKEYEDILSVQRKNWLHAANASAALKTLQSPKLADLRRISKMPIVLHKPA